MRPFWRRRRREAELDEEIAGHLEMAARDHEARGESPAEAAYAARREFGNATLVKEVTRRMWGGVWLDQLRRDLRLAVRSLRHAPAFTLVAILALGLGLGLSTAMFAVMDAVQHPRPLYANAPRLFLLDVRMGIRAGQLLPRDQLYRLIRERVPSLDALVPFEMAREPMLFGGEPREQYEYIVPTRWFDVMGIRPQRGRIFTPADGDAVAMVGYEVWKRALGGPRDLAGSHVTIGGRSYAVVGVLPPIPRGAGAIRQLIPADESAQQTMPLVRLRAGASQTQANRELTALARLLTATYATPSAPFSLKLVSWLDVSPLPDRIHDLRLAMLGAALAVLLIACVNLAHLMLARALAKRRELALRMALGADRAAAVRVMLAEIALVGSAGLALGAVLAVWGSRVLEASMPYQMSWLGMMRTQLSWRVFVLAAAAAVFSAVLFGLIPAVRVAWGVHITDPLKDEGGTTTGRPRRYSALVIGEVALTLALLMGGGLLLRSVHQLRTAPTGFDAEVLINAYVLGGGTRAAAGGRRDTTVSADWTQVLAAARAVPGIVGAALEVPARTVGAALTAEMEADTTRTITTLQYSVVSPNYLDVHGLPVLKGRDFEAGDAAGDGVAIVSAAAAARLYPRGDAVGRMLKLGGPATGAPWVRIVGVARTPLNPWQSIPGTGAEAPVWIVRPLGNVVSARVLARRSGHDPEVFVRLWHALRTVSGAYPMSVEPFTRARDASVASFNFLAGVFVAMGAIGLGLAALGLYGVLGYAVARRMREFAVRIALGADPATLFRMVMHDGLVMLLAGTGVGAFGALAAAHLFSVALVDVQPTDAISLVAAESVLLVVGLAATLAPAWRAVRANPLDIIRAV
jgi:predicted permease